MLIHLPTHSDYCSALSPKNIFAALLGTWQPVLELAGGGILSLPNGTLVIEEVSLADEGLYSCNVENGVGQPLSKTVWMSVNSKYNF